MCVPRACAAGWRGGGWCSSPTARTSCKRSSRPGWVRPGSCQLGQLPAGIAAGRCMGEALAVQCPAAAPWPAGRQGRRSCCSSVPAIVCTPPDPAASHACTAAQPPAVVPPLAGVLRVLCTACKPSACPTCCGRHRCVLQRVCPPSSPMPLSSSLARWPTALAMCGAAWSCVAGGREPGGDGIGVCSAACSSEGWRQGCRARLSQGSQLSTRAGWEARSQQAGWPRDYAVVHTREPAHTCVHPPLAAWLVQSRRDSRGQASQAAAAAGSGQ